MTLAPLVLLGSLSVYAPGDGFNSGALACGGRLTHASRHIAIREWRGRCGARAIVCSAATARCVRTVIGDSGPWGATRGGDWEVQVQLREGWRRRAVVDLTVRVWVELGRPRVMSPVVVWVSE